jgi:L-rhamnose mutarotase
MERKCFLLRVKPERLPDYLQAHQVWPEMLEAMREVGLQNYSLFYRPDGLLVGYLEGGDVLASLRQLGETDVNTRWQATMAEFFEAGSGDLESGGTEWLEQYFFLP